MRWLAMLTVVISSYLLSGCFEFECCFQGPGNPPSDTHSGLSVEVKTANLNYVLYDKLTTFAEANSLCNGLGGFSLSAAAAIERDLKEIFAQSRTIVDPKETPKLWSASDSSGKLILESTYDGEVTTILLQEKAVVISTSATELAALPVCAELKTEQE